MAVEISRTLSAAAQVPLQRGREQLQAPREARVGAPQAGQPDDAGPARWPRLPRAAARSLGWPFWINAILFEHKLGCELGITSLFLVRRVER